MRDSGLFGASCQALQSLIVIEAYVRVGVASDEART